MGFFFVGLVPPSGHLSQIFVSHVRDNNGLQWTHLEQKETQKHIKLHVNFGSEMNIQSRSHYSRYVHFCVTMCMDLSVDFQIILCALWLGKNKYCGNHLKEHNNSFSFYDSVR